MSEYDENKKTYRNCSSRGNGSCLQFHQGMGNATRWLGCTYNGADFIDYCMSKMTDKEAELFRERFNKGITQKELAKKWGVSQMYISRMEKKVIQKFRDIYIADNA